MFCRPNALGAEVLFNPIWPLLGFQGPNGSSERASRQGMGSDAVRPWVDQLPALSMGSSPIKQSRVKMRYELSKVMGVS